MIEEPIQEGDHQSRIQREFKDRLKKYKKEEQKKMPKQDAEQFDDPQCVVEFTQEIYQRMRKEEVENMVAVDYLSKVQTEIKDTSRAFLLEWIVDVHRKFRL
jgi:type IV secretory pathway component VirB8